jgi:hypothetical protein
MGGGVCERQGGPRQQHNLYRQGGYVCFGGGEMWMWAQTKKSRKLLFP